MTQYLPPDQLWSEDWGGKMDFDYDHETYWPALNELCRQRRAERMHRWEAGGKIVGESETYLQGGTDESIQGVKYEGPKIGWESKELTTVDDITEKLQEAKLEEDVKNGIDEEKKTKEVETAAETAPAATATA